MVIFVGAALAGFLLFGWINASPKKDDPAQKSWVRDFFLMPCVQGLLGSLALVALVLVLIVLMFPSVGRLWSEDWWSEYWAVRIALDLTGTEVAQLILGGVFGCILRYWGPQFWVTRMPPGTRYNWVAISLVGLLLLAAAGPYLGSWLRNSGITGLKTPVVEFQFAGKGKIRLPRLEKDLQSKQLKNFETLQFMTFSNKFIEMDLKYLELFPNAESARYREIYEKSRLFAKNLLLPLGMCANLARQNNLDIESIRHELQPIAQILYLLIKQGESILKPQSQDSISEEDSDERQKIRVQNAKRSTDSLRAKFLEQVDESLIDLNSAFVEDTCNLLNVAPHIAEAYVDPEVLAKAPHIYLALAYLDQFNDNQQGAISILEKAHENFGYDHSPGILFNINYSLFRFLNEQDKRDRTSILPFLDHALEIAQYAGSKIDHLKDTIPKPDRIHKDELLEQFELSETFVKNDLAYVSAEEGIRKFEALQYANHNYNHRDKLPRGFRPLIIDTYGYAKMAFEARKIPQNFDTIKEARALFREAISHTEGLPDSDEKFLGMKVLRTHLNQANMLLENQ